MSQPYPYYPHMHQMMLNGDRKAENFTEKDLYKLVKNEVGKLVSEQKDLERRIGRFLYELSQLNSRHDIFIDKNGNLIDNKTGQPLGKLNEFINQR